MALFAPPTTILGKLAFKAFKDNKTDLPNTNPDGSTMDIATQNAIYSPLFLEGGSPFETYAILLVAAKLLKTPEGMKVFRDIAVAYLNNVGKIVSTMEASSASNWMTAAINQRLNAKVMRRIGMIDNAAANEYCSWVGWVVNAMMVKAFVTETLGALSSFALGIGGLLRGGAGLGAGAGAAIL